MLPTLDVSFPIFAALICTGLTVAILSTRQLDQRLVRLLAAFFIASMLWNISLAWSSGERPLLVQWATVLCSVSLGILFWRIAGFGQEQAENMTRWLILGGAGAALAGLAIWGASLAGQELFLKTWSYQAGAVIVWLVFATQGLAAAGGVWPTVWTKACRYWCAAFVALGLSVGGVLCAWSPCEWLAPAWNAFGVIAITMAVLAKNQVEMRSVFRHLFVYIAATLLTGLVLVAFLLIAPEIFAGPVLILGVIIASGTLGVVYQVVYRVVRKSIDRLLLGDTIDYSEYLRTYNKQIRNVLDPEQLVEMIMSVVHEALSVERGALLVSSEGDDDLGNVTFHVVGELDVPALTSPPFRAFSPLMNDLRHKGLALSQEALDTEPRFQIVHAQERDWLKSLAVELYVPIRSRRQLVGILALGQRKNGQAFRADEIEFLSELADRSGFPLENARLFGYMKTLNTVLNRLYVDRDVVNRRMQEMDKIKSAFIGVITHELRSPLVGIDFSLQLLKRQMGDLSPQQQEPITDIVNGFARLKTMIDELVTFAAFLSKQGDLRIQEIDFEAVLREAVEPLEVMAQFRQISVAVHVEDGLPHIWADRERLSEAISHLVHNAIKFNQPQGKIDISCVTDGSEGIRFQVVDTGVGIENAKLERIWDSFSQSADPLRRGVEGLGLGLALVKYVVNAHGGKLWARSRLGEGSTFGFSLPINRPLTLPEVEMPFILPNQDQSWGR